METLTDIEIYNNPATKTGKNIKTNEMSKNIIIYNE
jgi:hypothetical protein